MDCGEATKAEQKESNAVTAVKRRRCIALDRYGRRCRRRALKRNGNTFVCRRHMTMWTMLLIDDQYSVRTRELLSVAAWDTADEGQRLIDRAWEVER